MKRKPKDWGFRPGDIVKSRYSEMRLRVRGVSPDGYLNAETVEGGHPLAGGYDPAAFELEGGKRGQMELFERATK